LSQINKIDFASDNAGQPAVYIDRVMQRTYSGNAFTVSFGTEQ
jgi:hypothetical protein